MFHSYVFTEMPYPYLPPESLVPNNRVTLPSSFYDPDAGYELYNKYYDIYQAADGLGFDIMVNEHHTTCTCGNAVVPLSMAILARETKNARILTLGNPIAHRPDPVRVAEEMATVDIISGGRIDVGFVRGVPAECLAVNSNPVGMRDRMWEAIDLIMKAFTTTDGPFNWEGEYYQHRQVNLWPRPFQQPHPPIWSPTTSAEGAVQLATRGITVATMAVGTRGTQDIFGAYRDQCAKLNIPAPLEKFAYSAQVFVGDTDEDGYREAGKLKLWYREAKRHPIQFSNPPGYLPPAARAKILAANAEGRPVTIPVGPPPTLTLNEVMSTPVPDLAAIGMMFAGNPDTVFNQMRDFFDAVGGLGNFIPMVQYASMSYDLTLKSMQRLANDVMPRFIEEVYEPTIRGDREIRQVIKAA